jgi:REP element-mobilizing transposase RayT
MQVIQYVVMPNHIHALITINDTPNRPQDREVLGVVVGGLKQAVTRFARRNNIEFDWQKRFHDHIIRSYRDGNNISEYIANNVANWGADCFNTHK